MPEIAVITSKAIKSNEYVHYFEVKTIEFYTGIMVISEIAVDFDEKSR